MSVLGPDSNSIIPEQTTSLQCIVTGSDDIFINHPAFTNDTFTCVSHDGAHSQTFLRVFCSASQLTEDSQFVGTIASDAQVHGNHRHVTVHVRGTVTMACVLKCLQTENVTPMTPISFKTEPNIKERFFGLPSKFVPPIFTRCTHLSDKLVGVVVELGRQPTNEVRIILKGGETYHMDMKARIHNDPESFVDNLSVQNIEAILENIDSEEVNVEDVDSAQTALSNLKKLLEKIFSDGENVNTELL